MCVTASVETRGQQQPGSDGETSASLRGIYFPKKKYVPLLLPRYDEMRAQLPAPICDEHPLWTNVYWKAWELAFRNFHEPVPESGFVSQFIDAAFNENIFLWDTCFMTMFCNYAHPLVPGIGSLDNFYAKQYPDGEICREINRSTGKEFGPWLNRERKPLFSRWGWDGQRNTPVVYRGRSVPEPPPHLTLDALNHPIAAWAEWESFRVTADTNRLRDVFVPLVKYYAALQKYLRQGCGLYMTDWASMDNSPRNPFLKRGGCGVDISSEMVLFARDLARMAEVIGQPADAVQYNREAAELAERINQLMWDVEQGFYFDLTWEGQRAPVKTIAAFWTLLAKVASPEQAAALVRQLQNPATFDRKHRVPTLAADQEGYDPNGGYWRGAVWAPMEMMVVRGLERYGYLELARRIALQHLDAVAQVYEDTGTIWENYAPDRIAPGKPAKKDFVGWSGLGPILFLLEYGIGLQPNAPQGELVWRLRGHGRVGCERFRFGDVVATLVAEPEGSPPTHWRVRVESSAAFDLRVEVGGRYTTRRVHSGGQSFEIRVR